MAAPPNPGNNPSQGYPAGFAAAPRKGRGKRVAIISVVAVLVLALGAGAFFVWRQRTAAAEVFLEPAASPGQNAFSDEPLADAPDPSIAKPASVDPPAAATASTPTRASSGGEPGLYGGTQNSVICDTAKMIAFMAKNPDKAAAWVQALNADADLRWEGGQLTVADIPTYLSELTPIVLVDDTRVTNHGFYAGKPTLFQSVLQKGSAVFVDKYGVPRVRCFCGNPLRAPIPAKFTPSYRGKAWPDFKPAAVSVVRPTAKPVDHFDVRVPAKPNATTKSVSALPKCPVLPNVYLTPPKGCNSDGTRIGEKKPTPAPSSTQPSPAASTPPSTKPSAPASSTPPPSSKPSKPAPSKPTYSDVLSKSKGTMSVTRDGKDAKGRTIYIIRFSGYDPNARINYSCGSGRGAFFSGHWYTDGNGKGVKFGTYGTASCFTKDPGFYVRDHFGTRASA